MNTKKIFIIGVFITIICVIAGNLAHNYFKQRENTLSESFTDRTIKKLQTQLNKNQKEVKLYVQLAHAYLQKVRETADVSYFKKVEDLMKKAESLDKNSADIYAIRASVAAGRHDFRKSRTFGEKALKLNPHKPLYYGIVGDALLELGEYEKAVEIFQKMMDLQPDFSSFNRMAYVRELYGDIEGAVEALELAISAGSPYPENIAWTYVELGTIYMRDNLEIAAQNYEHALTIVKDYPPALEGLGKVAFAKKNYNKSLDYFQKAFTKLPIAQYAVDIGDLYTKMGDKKKAKQQYTLAKFAFEKSSTSGVNTDLEMSYFLSDHDQDVKTALQKAQAAYTVRPSIYVADALAWAFFKNNKPKEAEKYMKEALQLGEHNALILFHAGMIAKENGNNDEAKRYLKKALLLHPNFSLLYAHVAEETCSGLAC